MSKERESRRRSPGIIARLMGMEALPPQQPTHKEHKRSSNSYQQRTESAGPTRKNNLYEGYSCREEKEFKDVFEVVETTDGYNSRYPIERNANSKLTEAKMAFFRQKVMDAKRFSTDDYLQVSKEFDDTLEVLDSNKDLFLKCLQERNSLFSKHLRDLQNSSAQSHNRHAVVNKILEPRKSSRNGICLLPDRETIVRTTSSSQGDYDGYLSHPHPRGTPNGRSSSKFPLEGEDDTSNVSTRIVILKPSMGRAQTDSKYVSSPHHSNNFQSDCRMQNELPNVKGRRSDPGRKKPIPPDDGLSRQKSQQSREIAKKVTRRMKNSLDANSFNFSSSRFKGYAVDESSYYKSGNESETESEVTTYTKRRSFDWNDWRGFSSAHSSASSSMNKGAKKRLTERWNVGHSFEEVGLTGRNSTLGEMLAISDKPGKAKKLGRTSGRDGRCDRFAGIQSVERAFPLGISSKEGWDDGYMKNLSRSRSLPASSAAFGSRKASKLHRTLSNDRYHIPNDAVNLGRSKTLKKHSYHRSGSSSRISRSPARNLKAYHYADSEDSDNGRECFDGQNQVKGVPLENYPSERNVLLSKTPICNFTEPCVAKGGLVSSKVEVELVHRYVKLSSESPSEMLAERPGSILSTRDDSSTQDSDYPIKKETSNEPSEEGPAPSVGLVPEPEPPLSPMEADQPSPVSVLEAPFPNDPPCGSDCFDSVSADLQGLRMQLQLLRLESEECEEGTIAISSDEDKMKEPVNLTHGIDMLLDEESWESSFMADVLISSGFGNVDPATFMSTWYSSECPIDPLSFQRLEFKYCSQSKWSRCEAKLLFDRINSGLVETVQPFLDPHLWLKPSSRQVGWRSEVPLEDDLYKLLERQETTLNMENLSEVVMKKEPKWLHLEYDIYEIGIELENQFIDELVREVVVAL